MSQGLTMDIRRPVILVLAQNFMAPSRTGQAHLLYTTPSHAMQSRPIRLTRKVHVP